MLVVQWQVSGSFGTSEDLDRRHRIEERLEAILADSDLGTVDGGDIGNGKMSVYCEVAAENAVAGCKAIIAKLDGSEIEGAVIAFIDDDDEDAEPNVLYPEDYTGTFSEL